MNMNEIPVATLALMRLAAKQKEDSAIAERREIDAAIAIAMKDRDEGSITKEFDGLKVSVTYKIDRKVATDKLQDRWEFISENAQRTFKWAASVDIKHLRALQELSPDVYAQAAQFIEAKPATPSVKVEQI